jgi:hypothetical protein
MSSKSNSLAEKKSRNTGHKETLTNTHTLTDMNVHTSYLYDHLQKTESMKLDPTGFKIAKVTTCFSLSTETSSPIEECSTYMRHQSVKPVV